MPERDRRLAQNVSGKFYVDESCIDCDLCRVTAPDNFRADEDAGHSYVHRQPKTLEEEALCLQAAEECPVEAIGSDGDGEASCTGGEWESDRETGVDDEAAGAKAEPPAGGATP